MLPKPRKLSCNTKPCTVILSLRDYSLAEKESIEKAIRMSKPLHPSSKHQRFRKKQAWAQRSRSVQSKLAGATAKSKGWCKRYVNFSRRAQKVCFLSKHFRRSVATSYITLYGT